MRIALLGSGEMGKQHRAAAAELPNVELVTRNSPPYDALDPADRIGLLGAMLADASIDAIDICLPTTMHAQMSCVALSAGKHVLCEKPMALNNGDCELMLKAQRTSGRILMVAQVLRFFTAYRHLAQKVRDGDLGRVRRAVFNRESSIPSWAPWMSDVAQSGGAILDLLVHDIDQAIALFGIPMHIEASRIESANSVDALLQCGEIPIQIRGGWFSDKRPFAMGFDVEFEAGNLVYKDNRLTLHLPNAQQFAVAVSEEDPYRAQLRYFVECCTRNSLPTECPPEASAEAVAAALHIRDLIA